MAKGLALACFAGLVALFATGCPSFGSTPEPECTSDSDCPSWGICNWFGECVGDACLSDGDCPPAQTCKLREAAVGKQGARKSCEARLCSCDVDCPNGLWCEHPVGLSTQNPHCEEPDESAVHCTQSDECASKLVCRPHGACDADQKVCAPVQCHCDDDCPEGQICWPEGARYLCVDAPVCDSNADCGESETCEPHTDIAPLTGCAADHPRDVCTAPAA